MDVIDFMKYGGIAANANPVGKETTLYGWLTDGSFSTCMLLNANVRLRESTSHHGGAVFRISRPAHFWSGRRDGS